MSTAMTFTSALLEALTQARKALPPEVHNRLSDAVALVKDGRVFQTTEGLWQVGSSSTDGLTYTTNGVCGCQDFRYNHPPQGLCKHRLAMFLSQRVLTLMHEPPTPVVPDLVEPWPDNDVEPAAQEPVQPPLPEAPASCNVFLTISGHKVQVTLRDGDEHRMLDRLQTLLQQYPLPQPAPQVPVQGQGKDWCATHQVTMQANQKDGRSWWSHRLENGSWCKGC